MRRLLENMVVAAKVEGVLQHLDESAGVGLGRQGAKVNARWTAEKLARRELRNRSGRIDMYEPGRPECDELAIGLRHQHAGKPVELERQLELRVRRLPPDAPHDLPQVGPAVEPRTHRNARGVRFSEGIRLSSRIAQDSTLLAFHRQRQMLDPELLLDLPSTLMDAQESALKGAWHSTASGPPSR